MRVILYLKKKKKENEREYIYCLQGSQRTRSADILHLRTSPVPGGGNRWPPAIVPDTRYVGHRALCTFGRVFASSFDLRGWRSTRGERPLRAERGRSIPAEVAGKRKRNNREGKRTRGLKMGG